MQSQKTPQARSIQSANAYIETMPVELRWLGAFRMQFEASGRGVLSTVTRGLFPMAIAAILIMMAEKWLLPRDLKYYLLCAGAAAIFLNGLRVVIQALRRRHQKVAIFEHGFTLWRNGDLSAFRWDQIEEIEVSESFFGFAVNCRTDDGRRTKIRFDAATDPTSNLRDLWRELEEQSSRHRILVIQKKLYADEEAVFVRKVWGRDVGTKIGVSLMGIRATPRYGKARFLDWSQVEAVKVDAERLIVTERDFDSPWLNESVMEVPGYSALVAVAEQSRKEYLDSLEQLGRDRIPTLMATLDTDQELVFGPFGVSLRGLRHESKMIMWNEINAVQIERDHLDVRAHPEGHRLNYGALSLADRQMLWAAVERALERAEEEDEMEDEFDQENELRR
ncbi:MAG TPA: hypothetical protein VJ810_00430 [Blastocatellia bacterium]|nr:hypothetical protein [Blastocatellia bacterium]